MGDYCVKKIFTILCALVLSVTMFAGCNLTTLNKSKYYKTVVVTVDGGEEHKEYNKEYNREDLLNAFYNYSYSNVSSGSVSAEDGLNTAIESMVNRDLLINFIKAEYFDTGILTLSDEDVKNIRYEAFEYMQDQIFSYENEVREEWDRVLTGESEDDSTETDESTSLRDEYNEYSSSLEAIYDGDNVIGFKNVTAKEGSNVKFDVPEKFEDFIKVTDEDVSAEAYARYVSSLQKSAKSLGKSTKESDVIQVEIDRLIKTLTENKYITLYQEWFNTNQQFETITSGEMLKDSVIDNVLTEFKKQYENQKKLYEKSESAYHTAMAGDDVSGIYYHPDYGQGTEYMYVSHILIQFSDAQKTQVSNLKSELENGVITQDYYDRKMEELIERTPVTYEENGVAKSSNAASVYQKVVNYVNSNASDDDNVRRAQLFNDMIYMFNDDPGIMNQDFAYVVNLDENVTDKMVKEFADACRELDKTEGEGGITKVVSEYGIHIIFHAGYVTSVDESVLNNRQTLLNSLVNHKTQLSSNKTLFDVIYDSLSIASVDTRSNDIVEQAKGYVKVTIYTKKAKSIISG